MTPFIVKLLYIGQFEETLCTIQGKLEDEHGLDEVIADFIDCAVGYMSLHDVGILEYAGKGNCRHVVFTDLSVVSLRPVILASDEHLKVRVVAGPEFPIERLKILDLDAAEAIVRAALAKISEAEPADAPAGTHLMFVPPSKLEEILYIFETIVVSLQLIPNIMSKNHTREKHRNDTVSTSTTEL